MSRARQTGSGLLEAAGERPGTRAQTEGPLAISLVVPVFNEQETIRRFIERVHEVLRPETDYEVEIVFVNDGSTDGTLHELLVLQGRWPGIRIVDLSRNFGKEAALSAGLSLAQGQVIVPIDVDLQDPPEIIPLMVAKWREGYDVVLGTRSNRDADSWTKRASAAWFYRLHNMISEIAIPDNVGDFRLMDRCVVDALRDMPESRRFMKGLFAWMGFPTAQVAYARPERSAGTTKFNGWKLWNFALEGVTSFSTAPLRVWTYIGGLVALVSIIFAIYSAVRVVLYGVDVPGYASMIVAITFLGGLQLMGIGVVGEYLGRTYIESKRRPVFLVRRVYENDGQDAP